MRRGTLLLQPENVHVLGGEVRADARRAAYLTVPQTQQSEV